MSRKQILKNRIEQMIDPSGHMAKVRYFINPAPLKEGSENAYYVTVLSKHLPNDQDICVPSRECADTSIRLAGEVVVPDPKI